MGGGHVVDRLSFIVDAKGTLRGSMQALALSFKVEGNGKHLTRRADVDHGDRCGRPGDPLATLSAETVL